MSEAIENVDAGGAPAIDPASLAAANVAAVSTIAQTPESIAQELVAIREAVAQVQTLYSEIHALFGNFTPETFAKVIDDSQKMYAEFESISEEIRAQLPENFVSRVHALIAHAESALGFRG